MKRLLLCVLLGGLAASWAVAQDSDDAHAKSKSDVRTVTGCLTQGDSADEFLLTASDGSTWEMRSNSSAKLADHVNQQVSITGAVSNKTAHNLKEDAKDAAADTGMKKSNKEHGHLKATEVTKISDSCQK
jgi:hypothetical protein